MFQQPSVPLQQTLGGYPPLNPFSAVTPTELNYPVPMGGALQPLQVITLSVQNAIVQQSNFINFASTCSSLTEAAQQQGIDLTSASAGSVVVLQDMSSIKWQDVTDGTLSGLDIQTISTNGVAVAMDIIGGNRFAIPYFSGVMSGEARTKSVLQSALNNALATHLLKVNAELYNLTRLAPLTVIVPPTEDIVLSLARVKNYMESYGLLSANSYDNSNYLFASQALNLRVLSSALRTAVTPATEAFTHGILPLVHGFKYLSGILRRWQAGTCTSAVATVSTAHQAGSTTLLIKDFGTGNITAGTTFIVAGSLIPYAIVNDVVMAGNSLQLSIYPPLNANVAANTEIAFNIVDGGIYDESLAYSPRFVSYLPKIQSVNNYGAGSFSSNVPVFPVLDPTRTDLDTQVANPLVVPLLTIYYSPEAGTHIMQLVSLTGRILRPYGGVRILTKAV